MPAPLDFSGWIPTEFASQIIAEATQASVVLSLPTTRVPMGTASLEMPVPRAFPKAGWTTAENPRKPFTDLKIGTEQLTAEEIAAVVAIPDKMIDDVGINVWSYVRPQLAEAIALGLDAAVLFGTDAPATFPAGGVAAAAVAVPAGIDAVGTVNDAMSAVEGQGLAITGHAADLSVKGVLRGVRDASGALLLGIEQADQQVRQTLYGLPVAYEPFAQPAPDFITGAWRYLFIGVRQDIRYEMGNGVLADEAGLVVISGFQDNATLLKVWARFACVLVKPVTPRSGPDGAVPFAVAQLAAGGGGGNGGGDGGGTEPAAQRAPAPRGQGKSRS